MQEIFENVRDEVKKIADLSWQVALKQDTPAEAAKFLDAVTNFCKSSYTAEEVEFLRFYFNMKMEMVDK